MMDHETLKRIVARAERAGFIGGTGPYPDKLTLALDIDAVLNEMPLRLKAWARADAFNFAHDIFGIAKHMNRKTAKLEGCFVPRFSGE